MTSINILVALKSGWRTSEHSLVVLLFETLAYVHCLTQETTYQLFPTPKQFAQDFRVVEGLFFKHLPKAYTLRYLDIQFISHSLNHSSIIQLPITPQLFIDKSPLNIHSLIIHWRTQQFTPKFTHSPSLSIIHLPLIVCNSLLSLLQLIPVTIGARGGVVVKALCYKPAGRGFDSRWCHWNFSVT